MLDVDPSVLRHWETEFPGLRPRRSRSGQRVYSQNDVHRAGEIKRLLREQGYTTRGALQALRQRGVEPRQDDDPLVEQNRRLRATLVSLREELAAFLAELEKEPTP